MVAGGVGAALGVRQLLHGGGADAPGTDASATTIPGSSTPSTAAGQLIVAENALAGTSDFAVRMEQPWVDMLHAWCDRDSVHQGETVTIYATTKAPTFTAEAFRFGWYGGAGGRKVWSAEAPLAGKDQAPPTVDAATNMRSCAHWEPSLQVDIDERWTPGMYLFRLIGSDGGNTFVPLVVLDDRRADLLVVSAITTWNAYNKYGGASLYEGQGGRSEVVTFDRPYEASGSGHFFGGEYELVQQVESMGLDVSYTTSIDLHARPEQIAAGGYKAVVSLAHDEYYSVPMRRALESARDAGVNLMFLGANAVFRRIRLEPSDHGDHRLEVNYRTARKDPLYGKGDQELVTAEWRSAPAADPEASLIGNYYESNPCKADMVVVDADSWVFEGTGLTDGHTFTELVQNEYDRVTPEVKSTPPTIEVLCHSPLVCRGKSTFADVTYYTAPSGAGVFATGTLWWERQLGAVCAEADGHTDPCATCARSRPTCSRPSWPVLPRRPIRPGPTSRPWASSRATSPRRRARATSSSPAVGRSAHAQHEVGRRLGDRRRVLGLLVEGQDHLERAVGPGDRAHLRDVVEAGGRHRADAGHRGGADARGGRVGERDDQVGPARGRDLLAGGGVDERPGLVAHRPGGHRPVEVEADAVDAPLLAGLDLRQHGVAGPAALGGRGRARERAVAGLGPGRGGGGGGGARRRAGRGQQDDGDDGDAGEQGTGRTWHARHRGRRRMGGDGGARDEVGVGFTPAGQPNACRWSTPGAGRRAPGAGIASGPRA